MTVDTGDITLGSTGMIAASSASLTTTSTFSLTTASGAYVQNGTLDLLHESIRGELGLQMGTTVYMVPSQSNNSGLSLTTVTAGNYPHSNIIDIPIFSTHVPCDQGISSVTFNNVANFSTGTYLWTWDVYGFSTTTGTPSLTFDHQRAGALYSFDNYYVSGAGSQTSQNRGYCVLSSTSTSALGRLVSLEQNGYHSYTGRFTVNQRDITRVAVSYMAAIQEEATNFGHGQAGTIIGSCRYNGPGTTVAPTTITFEERPTSLGQPTWCGDVTIMYRQFIK